jgi:hypothetical protein
LDTKLNPPNIEQSVGNVVLELEWEMETGGQLVQVICLEVSFDGWNHGHDSQQKAQCESVQ